MKSHRFLIPFGHFKWMDSGVFTDSINPLDYLSAFVIHFLFFSCLQEKRGPLLHCLARVLQLFEVSAVWSSWFPGRRCCRLAAVGCRELNSLSLSSVIGCLSVMSEPCMDFVQGDNKRSEAVSMLEQSSQAGCLQSSYLLWEHKRRAAVSFFLYPKVCKLWIQQWNPSGLFSFTCGQKQFWLMGLFLIFRWQIQADTSSV